MQMYVEWNFHICTLPLASNVALSMEDTFMKHEGIQKNPNIILTVILDYNCVFVNSAFIVTVSFL